MQKRCLTRRTKQDAVLTRVLTSVRNAVRGVLPPSPHQENHGVTLNLIQGLSMFIKSIGIDRCRIKFGMTDSCAKRTVKHLFPYSSIPLLPFKKVAFTLAETLIILGIIGVVAAITIPSVIQNYKKSVVETRLKKFYSVINQAINLSQAQNGSYMDWELEDRSDKLSVEKFYQTYLQPYLSVTKHEIMEVGNGMYRIVVWFPDGSLAAISTKTSTLFYPEAKDFVLINNGYSAEKAGTKFFTFVFQPQNSSTLYHGKMFEPYTMNNVEENIKTHPKLGCRIDAEQERALCAKWIQLNGWKIPKDYPLRF